MMFASDLDRTLIFSNKALKEFPIGEFDELIAVEQKRGENHSFMTKRSYEFLQYISAKLLFVPVTTRSLEQYRRIKIDNIPILYAVTTNGANILYKGEPLREWEEYVKRELAPTLITMGELLAFLQSYLQEIPGKMRIVDDKFFYFYLHEPVQKGLLEKITELVKKKSWRISLQGRKLYFVPTSISKGKAIRFIQEREGKEILIGAGDSSFDDDFLHFCHYPFVLRHGELANSAKAKDNYAITDHSGAKGGDEVLRKIMNLCFSNGEIY